MIFTGARFWNAGAIEGILVRGGKIVATGSLAELRTQAPGEPETDLGGGLALAGFADAHGHLSSLGESVEEIDLRQARHPSEVAAAVAAAPRHQGWVHGRAWNDAGWPAAPDARQLEAAARGDKVHLARVDWHAVWVNQAVLDAAGINRETPDPAGGRIERRADGTPSGVLVDNAIALVDHLLPEPTSADVDRHMRLAAQRCAKAGLTAVHDAGLTAEARASLLRLEARGELPIRVYGMQRENDPETDEVLSAGPRIAGAGGRVTLRAVKLWLDGALGSRGAAFFEPYADGVGGSGLLLEAREALVQKLAKRMRAGFQVALHAIGDRANALAIDAIAEAVALSGAAHLRPRIEHAQHMRPSDIPRLAQLGIIASMQPIHQANDWPAYRDRLGPKRYAGSYAWRTMIRSGVALAFGSDFPVESEDPRLGLHAALTRAVDPGAPEERLDPDQALLAFTEGAAFAAFEENQVGRFAPGYRADFSVFRGDPRLDPLQAEAVLTVLDGEPQKL